MAGKNTVNASFIHSFKVRRIKHFATVLDILPFGGGGESLMKAKMYAVTSTWNDAK